MCFFGAVAGVVSLFFRPGLTASDPADQQGSKDPKLFTRMPGFHIYSFTELAFDRYEFAVAPDRKETVEGHHLLISYYANEGIKIPSGLQVIRNYLNAAKEIGGKQVYAFEDGGTEYAILQVVLKDSEVWAEVQAASNGMYNLHLVERQTMQQDVTADAAAMSSSIATTGKVAVYGIYFDTDKALVKAESEPALLEIARMLQADAGLKVYVVGHTDNIGGFDHNIRLSKERAASVVSALTKQHSIAASRLQAHGNGPTAPVAANDTEAGRAKNRRVELVKQ